MKILVLAADYPNPNGGKNLYYIHSRNQYYVSKGLEVSVLNFAARHEYIIDRVQVYTLKSYANKLRNEKFDVLVCHAPNIRNHLLFLCKYGGSFPRIVFIFHGHEVLYCSKVYSKPFSYHRKLAAKRLVQNCYDVIKLPILKRCFEKLAYKSWFVFVSRWMYEQFLQWVKIDPSIVEVRKSIIYNCVGSLFECQHYDKATDKVYDFVTVRGSIDGSKYCIDIVTDLARSNPQYSFLVIGHGDFYRFNEKPSNVIHLDKVLSHTDLIDILNKARCALMPTRTDAQGVMACEIATFGMPLITSDIPVCKEVFTGFDNVAFINNDSPNRNFREIFEEITCVDITQKNRKFFAENTSGREVELFFDLLREIRQ